MDPGEGASGRGRLIARSRFRNEEAASPDAVTAQATNATQKAVVAIQPGDPLLYVGRDFESVYPSVLPPNHPRWRLRFLLRPTAEDRLIWQVGSVARVEGVEG